MKKTIVCPLAFLLALVVAFSCFATVFVSAKGMPALEEGPIFVFDIKAVNGVIEGEDCVLCTTQEAYDACNPNWAVTLLLQEQEDGSFMVARNPVTAFGSLPKMKVGDGAIALVVHSAAWDPGMKDEYPNVDAKLAAQEAWVGMFILLDGIDLEQASGSGTAALYERKAVPPITPENGVNVARGAKYVTSELFRQNSQWQWSPDEPIAYPDTNGVELTDGKFPKADATHYDEAFFGFRVDSPDCIENGYACIRVDLGQAYALSQLVLYVGGVKLDNGIASPDAVAFYTVEDLDGTNPVLIDLAYMDDNGTKPFLPCGVNVDVTAQFIEIRIFAPNWIFVTEFEAYAADLALGDLNHDGSINARDYLMLKRYCNGWFKLTAAQKIVADVNRDGKVNAIDYMFVKRAAMGTFVIKDYRNA